VQGGRPDDTRSYRPISQEGMTLWVPKEIETSGVIRFRRGTLRRKNLFFAEGLSL